MNMNHLDQRMIARINRMNHQLDQRILHDNTPLVEYTLEEPLPEPAEPVRQTEEYQKAYTQWLEACNARKTKLEEYKSYQSKPPVEVNKFDFITQDDSNA